MVALIDSSKFGKVDFAPFARIDQLARIFTDSALDPAWIDKLRNTNTMLTICDERKAFSLNPDCPPDCTSEGQEGIRHFKIGFANLSDESPFALEVRRGLRTCGNAQSPTSTWYLPTTS